MHFEKLVLLDETVRSLELCFLVQLLDIRITVRCKILMFLLSSADSLCCKYVRLHARADVKKKRENCAQKADLKVSLECFKQLGLNAYRMTFI